MKNNYFFYLIFRFYHNIKNYGFKDTIIKVKKYIILLWIKNDNILFYTSKKKIIFFKNFDRDIKHFYLSKIKSFNSETIIKDYDKKFIFSEFKYLDFAIKQKLLNFRSILILQAKYDEYIKIAINQKQFIDFLLLQNDELPIGKINFQGYFITRDNNWPLFLDRLLQIFMKKQFMMIPIIKSHKFDKRKKIENSKTIYLKINLLSNNIKNIKSSNFENIINKIDLDDIEYLYISEDLYWFYNSIIQVKNISIANIKIFLKHSLSNGVLVKNI